jgi:ligand-binding SRPBCC domain-containing protein
MKIYSLVREQLVKAPLGETWAFFSNPANLKKITPPEMGFHILTPDLPQEIYAGLFIEYKVSPLLGIPITWVTEITQVEKGVVFCDEQRIGPYRIWSHKHFFRKEGRQTRMFDRVDYALPPVPFQGLINSVVVSRKLESIFDYRYRAVEQIFR